MSLLLRASFVAAASAFFVAVLLLPVSAQEEGAAAEEPAAEEPAAEEPAAEEPAAEEPEAGDPAETPGEPEAAPRRKAAAPAGRASEERKAPNLFPEVPSVYWVVDFEPQSLRMISPKEGLGAGRVYWYMIYHLKNPGQEDRDLFLEISAASDNGKTYSDMYLPSVERAIEKKEADPNLWGKTDIHAVASGRERNDPKYNYFTLKAGERKRCVAVFNRLDLNANKITIRVAGLSNEIGAVAKDDGARDLEERVREFYYERAGDEYAATLDSFVMKGKDWVKRRVAASVSAASPR